ncbi:type II toxin-antitoxin system VapC family toxin [Microlunatus elymi]|uniref:Ribonuclease VapC n=1 Tax=Microlunatus elymi TaxID=2596828 RepID=A0A516Q361_9ACTN|nr:PIN domain-containing protein [Microlunatus elymi]QDP97848.1 type II toxin-antitoxin system VapC family toxin [Microlunatus elymi]
MARRLILDTGILINSERGGPPLQEVIEDDDDLVIAAITVAELRTGIELASDAHRANRSEFLVRVLETLPIQSYDLAAAEVHGRLLAHVHRAGAKRGAHDLIIAATAVATNRIVLTRDRQARFGELPGVECITID